ncbi:MAG TPA: TonB-dependent receptor, partial [Candidatus Angelobacter sp.]
MKVVKFFGLALVLACVCTALSFAQSITSGDIAGVVTDPTGAVVPNAQVTATSDSTGATHTTNSNGEGLYRFSFLQPGTYTLGVKAGGFQPGSHKIQVSVGQTANGNIALAVTAATTTIEVTGTATQIDNADLSTNFSQEQISLVPNPGNDMSAVAQTSPGIVMNTQGGFGNFSSFGLPGTSNLFTLDGQNDNDPFLNLNNSGATNLLLGANEVQEATVTSNGYSGQYGQLAGAQVNYVTKSGGNQFHGNASYFWNGRVLNADSFLNKEAGLKKNFDNVNQWAASFGGPIVKDKTFFFWDYEGLRVVLPTSQKALIPSLPFETATIANLNATGQSASVPFYNTIFNLYNSAKGAAGAVPAQDCSAFPGIPVVGPCTLSFRSTAGNFTHEYLMALRIDHKFSDNDNIFGRVQTDRGVQATNTDPINPLFNVQSNQPEYQGQLGWTHILNPNMVNEFKMSGAWYSAIFVNANLAATLAAFPTTILLNDGSLSDMGGIDFVFPQGRNVTQYQGV